MHAWIFLLYWLSILSSLLRQEIEGHLAFLSKYEYLYMPRKECLKYTILILRNQSNYLFTAYNFIQCYFEWIEKVMSEFDEENWTLFLEGFEHEWGGESARWWISRVVNWPGDESARWWISRVVSPPGGGSAWWLVRRVVGPPGCGSARDECAREESAGGESAGHRNLGCRVGYCNIRSCPVGYQASLMQ